MPDDRISKAFEEWYSAGGDRQRLKDAFRAGWIACGRIVLARVSEMDLAPGGSTGTAIGQGEYPIEDL